MERRQQEGSQNQVDLSCEFEWENIQPKFHLLINYLDLNVPKVNTDSNTNSHLNGGKSKPTKISLTTFSFKFIAPQIASQTYTLSTVFHR